MTADPDIDLVLRVIVDDDRHAFGELVKRHQSPVRNLLRRLTRGDFARADDLAQDTFVKAFRSIRSFKGTSRFSSWLYRIAYNTFLSDLRKQKPNVPFEEAMGDKAVQPNQRSRDHQHDIHEAMKTFSPEQTAIFDLHYKKGLTHLEISETLGIPLGTVKTTLLRGLETLRKKLGSVNTP